MTLFQINLQQNNIATDDAGISIKYTLLRSRENIHDYKIDLNGWLGGVVVSVSDS